MNPIVMNCAMEGVKIVTGAVLQGHRTRHSHLSAQLHASTLKDMVDAVTTRQLSMIEKQCSHILTMYADQARSYMDEKKEYTAKILSTTDAFQRIELGARVDEIDSCLAEIRADAKLLFGHMGELLTAVGGKNTLLAGSLTGPLALPTPL